MTPSREHLAAIFADHFNRWRIQIPKANVTNGKPGFIAKQGWLIQFCFGTNSTGDYLDYYAAHRMTDDSHVRLHGDGQSESLPTIRTMHVTSEDPAEARRLAEENRARNREVLEGLVAKGFGKATINMVLGVGLEEETE